MGHTLYDSIFRPFSKEQNDCDEKQIRGFQALAQLRGGGRWAGP